MTFLSWFQKQSRRYKADDSRGPLTALHCNISITVISFIGSALKRCQRFAYIDTENRVTMMPIWSVPEVVVMAITWSPVTKMWHLDDSRFQWFRLFAAWWHINIFCEMAYNKFSYAGLCMSVSLTVFARKSNSMETSPCHASVAGHQIATNFCTYHDSTAVVPCTKFCSDHCIRIDVRVKHNFHRIWIAMEKKISEMGPRIAVKL